jgi:hypothetical protein
VYCPGLAVIATWTVSVTVALGLTIVGLKLAVKPELTVVVRVTWESNPFNPVTDMNEVLELPTTIVREVGNADMVKSAAGAARFVMVDSKRRAFAFRSIS